MDVVFITTWPPAQCGIATYTQALADEYKRQGHRVTVLAEHPGRERRLRGWSMNEANVYRCWNRAWAMNARYGLSAVVRLVKSSEKPPDVVHFQHEFGLFPDSVGFLNTLSELHELDPSVKTAITFHTVAEHFRLFFRELGRLCPKTVCYAHSAEAAAVLIGAGVRQVRVVPHGVTVNTTGEAEEFSDYYFVPGFISPSKGHGQILEAYARVRFEYGNAPRLRIVGLCRDDNYAAKLEAQIRGLFLDGFATVESRFVSGDELHKLYRGALAVVLGHESKERIYSASGQLALALGTASAVIATDAPIYSRGGGILRYRNAGECARAMRAVQDVALRHHLRAASLDEAMMTSWESVVKMQTG